MPVNLLFVHGIRQDPKGKDALLKTWRNLLAQNASRPGLFDAAHSSMAFYADILGPAAQAAGVFEMGTEAIPDDVAEAQFIGAGLRQMAKAVSITDRQIAEEADKEVAVPQSNVFGRTLVGALAALEGRIPSAGILGVRVLKEAYIYLTKPATQAAIDERLVAEIKAALERGGPLIVVSHSLGTVVAFRLLRDLALQPDFVDRLKERGVSLPLLVTMGSPLGVTAVKNRVGLPTERPAIVGRWANFFDRGDLVALGQGLTTENFGRGIDNDNGINNQTSNAHSINGYLNHPHIIAALEDAILATGE